MFVSLSIYISQKLKYMDILLVILGVICLLVGLAGFRWGTFGRQGVRRCVEG